jgi:hypothetical protein
MFGSGAGWDATFDPDVTVFKYQGIIGLSYVMRDPVVDPSDGGRVDRDRSDFDFGRY